MDTVKVGYFIDMYFDRYGSVDSASFGAPIYNSQGCWA
jgi:hypothetical protein